MNDLYAFFLGNALQKQGRLQDALPHYEKYLRVAATMDRPHKARVEHAKMRVSGDARPVIESIHPVPASAGAAKP